MRFWDRFGTGRQIETMDRDCSMQSRSIVSSGGTSTLKKTVVYPQLFPKEERLYCARNLSAGLPA